MEEEKVSITVRAAGSRPPLTLSMNKTKKVLDVKEHVNEKWQIPVVEQRLVYRGKMLRDDETLSSLGVAGGHVFHLIRKVVPAEGGASRSRHSSVQSTQSEAAPIGGIASPGAGGLPSEFQLDASQISMENLMEAMSQFGREGVPAGMETNMRDMLQNPGFQNTMRELFGNPELMRNMFRSNPFLGQMMDNPFVRQMMENPELLRSLMSPEILNASLQFQQQIMRQAQSGEEQSTDGGFDNMMRQAMQVLQENPETREQLMTALAAGGTIPAGGVSAEELRTAVAQPPEVQYAAQLKQLQDMGFIDKEANIQALDATGGSVDQSISWLLEKGFGNG